MRRAYDALGFGVGNLAPAPGGNALRPLGPRVPVPAQVVGGINQPQPPANMAGGGAVNVRQIGPLQSKCFIWP